MSKLKANKQEDIIPFKVMYGGEEWTVYSKWVNSEGETVWYDAKIIRDNMEVFQYFSPEEVEHDQKD